MKNLKKLNLEELNLEELKKINGGETGWYYLGRVFRLWTEGAMVNSGGHGRMA
jgi:hypothetical protein